MSNTFGTLFKITTWGESHGKAIGVVIDGCPAGLELCEEDIQQVLAKRAPGKNPYTSPRKEEDTPIILSGVFEGKTTGAPISIMIQNLDTRSSAYEPIKHLLRPGHANATYLQKYGIFDHRGGGRASARETAARVAAGAVADKLLKTKNIQVSAYLTQVGHLVADDIPDFASLPSSIQNSPLFCPDERTSSQMIALLEKVQKEGDSLGGVVSFQATGLPVGLGEPLFGKLEAKLAHAMMSLPASKGFEMGSGFSGCSMKGSQHNDLFIGDGKMATNHGGGTLGGISSGMPLYGKVAFKPTSSIKQPQETLTTSFEPATLELPEGSRHDPCVAIRAVPVVQAMLALVLADCLLLNRSSKIAPC